MKCKFCGKDFDVKNKFNKSSHLRYCKKFVEYKDNILTKNYLELEYIAKQRSAIELALEHNLESATPIINLLKKYNISVRNVGQSCDKRNVKIKKTCIKKYGTENVLSNGSIIRDKM